MTPTISNEHWLDWFKDISSSSNNTTPPITSPDAYHSTLLLRNLDTAIKTSTNTIQPTVLNDHNVMRSSWRWSTLSVATTTTILKRNSTLGIRRLNQYKRRTYPPGARRVLKKEHLRFIDSNSANRRFSTRKDFLRRRHSLSGILLSFVQSGKTASSSSFPLNTGPSNRIRGFGLPFFFSSFHGSTLSRRKSNRKATSTVRSSMVLQLQVSDETDPIYISNLINRGTTSSGTSGDKKGWFSHWILNHPRSRPSIPINNNIDNSNNSDYDTTTKKPLPLIRQATVSDLSTLSDSCQKPCTPTTTTLSFYFSATWKSHTGKSGTKVIRVNETGQLEKGSWWESCDHEQSVNILAGLFLTGFLLCPSWWIGAALYLSRSHAFNTDLNSVHLWTPRTLGHLNCWMSATSLLLVGGVVGVFIWYHLPL